MTEFRSLSETEFTTWHEQYKADNGYPLQGRNAASGELVDVGWTTEYTEPLKVDAGDVRFVVDAKVSAKPGVLSAAPVYKADGTIDVLKSKNDTKPK